MEIATRPTRKKKGERKRNKDRKRKGNSTIG